MSSLPIGLLRPTILKRNIRQWGLWFNSRFHSVVRSQDGVDVASEDWDNLFILDACRFDVFEEESEIEGDLQRRQSQGSSTGDFLMSNFADSSCHDTVYVSANPHIRLTDASGYDAESTFYAIYDLAHDDTHWDRDLKTVPPEAMVRETERILQKHPNKRFIVHFMQPHYPFIGEEGRQLDFDDGIIGHMPKHTEKADSGWKELGEMNVGPMGPWFELPDRDSETHDAVWRAYRENLRIVLDSVSGLLNIMPGKSVVSSDHGNLIGDRLFPIPVRGYGHPSQTTLPKLHEIPWLVVDSDERRTVWAEDPIVTADPDPEVVKDRLADLGYLT